MKRLLFFFLLFLSTLPSWGQDFTLLSKPGDDGIQLRWFPGGFNNWNAHLSSGYRIECSLNGGPFQPVGPAAIVPALPVDSPEDTLLQAILGYQDSLAVLRAMPQGPRFLEGTYQSFLQGIAITPGGIQQSGLYFLDSQTQADQEYRYRLRSASGTLLAEASSWGTVKNELPILSIRDEENVARITWSQDAGIASYKAFRLERSTAGGHFTPRPEAWIFSWRNPEQTGAARDTFHLVDTALVLDTPYHYRLVGVSAFGEQLLGQPVRFVSRDQTPPARPRGFDVEVAEDKSVVNISWEKDEVTKGLAGYHLYRSRFPDSAFARLTNQLLPPAATAYTDASITPTGEYYYRVVAVDAAGNERSSFRKSVVFPDKTPPAVPAGLRLTIDKKGVANIAWTANTESDLRGYQLAIARYIDNEFVPVTSRPITRTSYQDTLALNFENREVYYQIASLDQLGNLSAYSPPVQGLLPDTIPPVVPVLEAPERKENTLILRWQAGLAPDLKYVEVFRRRPEKVYRKTGVRVAAANELQLTGLDTMAGSWVFAVRSVDASGNQSPFSNERLVNFQQRSAVAVPDNLEIHDLNKEEKALRWTYPGSKAPVSFLVFRLTEGSNQPELRGRTGDTTFTIPLETGKSRYTYFIVAQDNDHRLSSASVRLEVVL